MKIKKGHTWEQRPTAPFSMTEIEGRSLRRKPINKPIDWKEWAIDIAIGGVLACMFAGLIIGLAVTILMITPGVRAADIEDNAFYCQQIAEGKANVAPENREEVSAYCAENHG